MTDLTYTINYPWVKFLPETPAGEDAWRVMANHPDGDATVIAIQHLSAVTRQLRAAGYSVRRRRVGNTTPGEIDELLAELTS